MCEICNAPPNKGQRRYDAIVVGDGRVNIIAAIISSARMKKIVAMLTKLFIIEGVAYFGVYFLQVIVCQYLML